MRAIDDTDYAFLPASPAEAEKKMDIIGESGMALISRWLEQTSEQAAQASLDDVKN